MASTSVAQNCRIDDLENEVTEVTALLRHNVEKILERGEKIDKLQSRSEDLECSSSNFKLSAAKARRKMWWRNFRLSCILGFIIFIILVITITVILVITNPWASPDNRGKHNCTEHVDCSSRSTLLDVILYP